MKKTVLGLAVAISVLVLSGCSKTEKKSGQNSGAEKKQSAELTVPHGVAMKGGYWTMSSGGSMDYYADAVEGTLVEICTLSNGEPETRRNASSDDRGKNYVHVKLDDENFWIFEDCLVQNATPAYILETGTDTYVYDNPDADANRIERLNSDTIVACLGECENSSEFKNASKFRKVIYMVNFDDYAEGFVMASHIDDDPAHIALIQVSKKYYELSRNGTVSADVLNELSDTIDDLSSWSGR